MDRNNKSILCIDLKSFFASCECVVRGLDPFTTPLVVADPARNGALTLAVTPYLKQFGVKSRGRVYELPKDINIIKIPPHMRLYQKMSKDVIKTYLEFISIDDIHIYSIDECFLDVTNYLKMYKMNAYELAKTIINKVYENTKLTVTAGIGPNMLLAKVAMDIEAKHVKDNIAVWTYDDVKTKLWNITPLSKMWGIGINTEKSLNELGLYSIGDVAKYDKNKLIKRFGVIGEELWNHCNGIDNTTVKEANSIESKEKSLSRSQILFKDYYGYNIPIILYETCNILARELRMNKVRTSLIGLTIRYSKSIGGGFHHSMKINDKIDNENKIYDYVMYIFDRYYQNNMPIRGIAISVGKLTDNNEYQINIFEDFDKVLKDKNVDNTIDQIKDRFGPNSLLKGSSLLADSTIKDRNGKIGGHAA
ncbi:MAG: damage repair protein [Bacilli bacterium]|nr:damage repair protein [Bacilli bacterium]